MLNPPPIVSLSLNPAIDLTYETPTLLHEQKSRASTSRYDPGGTGINVGRALQQLKAHSHTCYISAGMMGAFLDEMLKHQLNNLHTIRVEGETRINTTILQQSPAHQYEINATGPEITAHQSQQIISQFLTLCQQGIGVLTGSLPPGMADNTYQLINIALKKQGAKAIIDAPVAVLTQAINSQPFLIKPNLHELQLLCKKELNTIEKIALEARKIALGGTQNICVSLGDKGALLTTANNSYYCQSPLIKTHSTVGAGDSLVAGLAHGFTQGLSEQQILKLAVACGAGTAKRPGTLLFKEDELKQITEQLTVKSLDI